MAANLPAMLKGLSLDIEGTMYPYDVESIKPPEIKIKTEEGRGGALDTPIEYDMGLEKLETEFVLVTPRKDIAKMFGISKSKPVTATFRSVFEDDETNQIPVVLTCRGKIKEMIYGDWKTGEKATTTYKMTLTYYKEEIDGSTITEIDVKNFKRVIDGTDQLESMRGNLNIG